ATFRVAILATFRAALLATFRPLGAGTVRVRLVFRRGCRGFSVSGRTVFRSGAGFGFAPHTPAAKPSRAALHELVEHFWVYLFFLGGENGVTEGNAARHGCLERTARVRSKIRFVVENPALGYMASSRRFGDIRKPGWLRLI
ncbi:MAG TPA: hypothetical protein VFP10_00885, partial [Candidatus Eisenbacteria bacterium]|nr:hypothetical protein [Candidatus Eisenbacteria bacterium]